AVLHVGKPRQLQHHREGHAPGLLLSRPRGRAARRADPSVSPAETGASAQLSVAGDLKPGIRITELGRPQRGVSSVEPLASLPSLPRTVNCTVRGATPTASGALAHDQVAKPERSVRCASARARGLGPSAAVAPLSSR